MRIDRLFNTTKLNHTEVGIFLSYLLKKDRSFIIAHPEFELTQPDYETFREFEARRNNHEPLAYILGFKDFYGLKVKTDKRAAIPRPDSESLVDEAIKFIFRIPNRNRTSHLEIGSYKIADIGTGSGCIAISLAKSVPFAHVYAIELDSTAASLAKENIKANSLDKQITLLEGDLLSPLKNKVDMIIANLPYIPTNKISHLDSQIKNWEPVVAFDGGTDGLVHYRRLFKQATNYLNNPGIIIYELDGRPNILEQPFVSKPASLVDY